MTIDDIYDILKIILNTIEWRKFIWRVEWSVNLVLQWVDTTVRDLDITTNDNGIEIFRECLNKYIVKDFFSEKINGKSLVCDINWFEIEINYYWDRYLNMFDKIKKIQLRDISIPILPLEYAKILYENIWRKEKVDLIEKFL